MHHFADGDESCHNCGHEIRDALEISSRTFTSSTLGSVRLRRWVQNEGRGRLLLFCLSAWSAACERSPEPMSSPDIFQPLVRGRRHAQVSKMSHATMPHEIIPMLCQRVRCRAPEHAQREIPKLRGPKPCSVRGLAPRHVPWKRHGQVLSVPRYLASYPAPVAVNYPSPLRTAHFTHFHSHTFLPTLISTPPTPSSLGHEKNQKFFFAVKGGAGGGSHTSQG